MSWGSSGLGNQVRANGMGFSPDTTLTAAITAHIAAGTTDKIKKLLITVSTAANRTISLAAANALPHGMITDFIVISSGSYICKVDLFCIVDVESAYHAGTPDYWVFDYQSGQSVALGQQILVQDANSLYVDGINTGGMGKVVYLDTTNFKVGVLI